ncbi:MAG: Subtilase family protein [Candidatus Udaeobacter sp.]|nr:MAG: Subtilase family protein [Candidatus Udaeobacter sp.]
MKTTRRFNRNRFFSYLRITIAVTLVTTGAAMAFVATKPSAPDVGPPAPENGVYIVQMLAAPAVSYSGGIAGYNATAPQHGRKIDPAARDTVRYVGYLKSKHDAALRKVGGGQKIYDYGISYNGFAAKLTAKQSAALKKQDGVLAVTPDEMVSQDTSSTPHFLGLDAPSGIWEQLGGPTGTRTHAGAGENIVIGVVDSGIWPQSKSFSDRDANGKLIYQPFGGRHGRCEESSADGSWSSDNCNKKLMWARHFNAAWGGDPGIQAQRPWEFLSPRDYNGHGTHTTSTAGGNNGTPTTGPAAVFGPISGMAPRARVATYKALWSTQDASTASGFTSDLVAAIDQAVADGVDVINYSISGTRTNFLDPVQVSFLFAADAGVFVSASAGNDGPPTGTVAHPGPWLTTVAAGTHNRNGSGSVTLGNSAMYTGASVASPVGPAPFIRSTDAGLPGANADAVRQCFAAVDNGGTPVLDPAIVAGKIVLCDRGVNARVNKSLAVSEAGGVGMVLANTSPNSLNADFHFIPTVHVADTDRAALIAYSGTPEATATINQSTITFSDPAPFTAAFSSRGPLAAGGGDLLKPDVIAPGQDVLAAVAPPGNHGLDFNLLSGTSMSAPHVAGVAALLMHLHPTWSPMMIKSALMTSGYDVLDGPNTNPLVIFRQGAGHIRPNSAADPGLVYNSGFNDWLAFLCGTTNGVDPATCTALENAGYSLEPSDLNVASIAIGDLAGIQTVTRKVTNVGGAAATYTPSTTGLTGITVDVQPTSLSLSPGQTGTFTVMFTRTTAPLNAYVGGQLTWTDGTHNVRIPMVIKPVPIAAPLEVTGSPSGISYEVTTGYSGTLNFAARGLVPAATFAETVAQDPDQTFDPNDPTGTIHEDIVVPAGRKLLRVGIDEGFITPSRTDLDVYVYVGATRVGQSSDGDSNEMVTFTDPPAGTYRVYVHGFNTNGPSADFTLFSWQLTSASAGNMNVPGPVGTTIGGTVPVNLTFTGLVGGTWYLGQTVYNDGTSDIGTTIVNVK